MSEQTPTDPAYRPSDREPIDSAFRRNAGPLRSYKRLALGMCYAIALALIVRRTGEGSYEGVITFAGVFAAWCAGVLSCGGTEQQGESPATERVG